MDELKIDEQLLFGEEESAVSPELIRITGLLAFLQEEGLDAEFQPPESRYDDPGILLTVRDLPYQVYLTYHAVDPDDLNRFFLTAISFFDYPEDMTELLLYEGELFLSRLIESPGKEGMFLKASMPEYGGISPEGIRSFLRRFIFELRCCPG